MGTFIMTYPKWFPYPICWLRAIGLIFYNIPAFVSVFIISRLMLFYGVAPVLIINSENKKVILVIGLMFFVGCLMVYWLSFSYLHFFFWGKPDPNPKHLKWLPSNQSMVQGFKLMCVSIITIVFTVLLLVPFANFRDEDWFDNFSVILYLSIAAYCFYVKLLISKYSKKDGNISRQNN